MKLERLIYILLSLEKKKKITAKRLAEELETSIRTIYRDIDTLCSAGIPICTESGQHGGISLMEGYQTQVQHFDKEDIIYLFLNGKGVKAEKSRVLDKHTDISLKKIIKALPDTEAEEIEQIVNRFVVDSSPWWGEEQSMPQMDTILQAVFELHKLKITYQKINQEVSSRTIRPYGIVIKEMIWYLIGYCESSFTIRMFRCDRIMDCQRLEDTFIYPKNFELKSYFKDAIKGFHDKCVLEEQYLVTMLVSEKAFCYLEGLEYSILWHDKDQWKICVNLYGFEHALNDYWNIIINATSVEPAELREALYNKLSACLDTMK